MTLPEHSLEPLADYLELEFGNIYAYGLPYAGSFQCQEWTDKLRRAVKRYLVHEMGSEEYRQFLLVFSDTPNSTFGLAVDSRDKQVERIIDVVEARDIAAACHSAAINAIPELDQVVTADEAWGDTASRVDVSNWLDCHATADQLRKLAEFTGYPERKVGLAHQNPESTAEDLTFNLTPADLIYAWHMVVAPAESDLTEVEWDLIAPLFATVRVAVGVHQRSQREFRALRSALDGMRFRFAHEVSWSAIPRYYGKSANIYQRYVNYQKRGEFSRALKAVEGRSGGKRLVSWLESVAK